MTPFQDAFLSLHRWGNDTRSQGHLKEVRLIFDTPYAAAKAAGDVSGMSGKVFGVPYTITSDPR